MITKNHNSLDHDQPTDEQAALLCWQERRGYDCAAKYEPEVGIYLADGRVFRKQRIRLFVLRSMHGRAWSTKGPSRGVRACWRVVVTDRSLRDVSALPPIDREQTQGRAQQPFVGVRPFGQRFGSERGCVEGNSKKKDSHALQG